MDTVHWLRDYCQATRCQRKPSRIELRRTTLGAYWEGFCNLHTSEDEYGPSILLAVEVLPVKVAA